MDFYILIPYIFLCTLGILMVYSSSSYQLIKTDRPPSDKAIKQLIYFIVSFITLIITYRINLETLRKKKIINFLLLFSFLTLLMLPIIGTKIGGAKRWIDLGIISFQPSELVPLVLIIYLSSVLAKNNRLTPFSFELYKKPMLICLFFIVIVAMQPNVAGASMIFILTFILFLSSGLSPIYLLLAIGGFVGARQIGSKIALSIPTELLPEKFSYLITRFQVMINPFDDPTGIGFQTSNSYYAMHNGGLLGLGLGNSIQKKGFLPAADTDYIFAICIEELGLIFALLILGTIYFMVARLLLLSIRSKNLYYSFMYLGCSILLCLQISVNVGSLLGYIPMTGITFPFISYGGSSMLILSITLGIALNVYGTEKRELQ